MKTDISKPRILLHVCCAPCSTTALDRLMKKYDILALWFNPNIYPIQEQIKRKNVFIDFVQKMGVPIKIIEGDKYIEKWQKYIKGTENELEGGERCRKCFEFRLKMARDFARENNFDLVSTTLTVSPYKDSETIFQIENALCDDGLTFLHENFKENDGYKKSIELSKKHNLYRQKYCGCKYSMR